MNEAAKIIDFPHAEPVKTVESPKPSVEQGGAKHYTLGVNTPCPVSIKPIGEAGGATAFTYDLQAIVALCQDTPNK